MNVLRNIQERMRCAHTNEEGAVDWSAVRTV
jgi:hypothetical protein